MTTPSRDQAIAILDAGFVSIRDVADALSDDDFARSGTIGGGDWSAKDLIGHLQTWEEFALEAMAAWREGDKAPITDRLDVEGVDAVNRQAVRAKAAYDVDEARRSATDTHRRVVSELQAIGDGEWSSSTPEGSSWGGRLGDILEGLDLPFAHADAHIEDLQDFADSVRT